MKYIFNQIANVIQTSPVRTYSLSCYQTALIDVEEVTKLTPEALGRHRSTVRHSI